MQHLALIMDGNRRWALKRSLKPWLGHNQGAQVIREVIRFCKDHAITYLSLYAFSLENFKRSPQELTFLFKLFIDIAHQEKDILNKQGIRIRVLGERTLFPHELLNTIAELETLTAHNTHLTVHLLFCYGAQQEITSAVQTIAHKVKAGLLEPAAITPATLTDNFWTQPAPPPELIIRTGGRKRLSNFLLFQAAYSELYFLDCLWPDLKYDDLAKAVTYFEHEQRNFGT